MTISGKSRSNDHPETEIGIDLSEAIGKGAFRITIGKRVSEHWSLEGSHELMIGMLLNKKDDDEKIHYGEVNKVLSYEYTMHDDLITGGISIKYWTAETHKGAFMQAGCKLGTLTGLDCTAGLGYSIGIWRGIRCTISYEINIRDSIIRRKTTGKGISLTLSYSY